MDLDFICTEIRQLVLEVGLFQEEEIDKVSKGQIESKELNSLVSYVDKRSEEMIVKKARTLIPGCGFITEEDSVTNEEQYYTWIIDPLDGTTNYLHKIPHYSISIALRQGEDLVLGVVYDPSLKECFYAIKGQGAYLNGEKIQISSVKTLKNSLIVTGFPFTNDYNTTAHIGLIEYWLTHTRGIRRLGSAALDLVYVACGRLEAYYEGYLNTWDLAAGALIVMEAGGKVTDLEGDKHFLKKGSIIACSEILYPEIHLPISKFLIGGM